MHFFPLQATFHVLHLAVHPYYKYTQNDYTIWNDLCILTLKVIKLLLYFCVRLFLHLSFCECHYSGKRQTWFTICWTSWAPPCEPELSPRWFKGNDIVPVICQTFEMDLSAPSFSLADWKTQDVSFTPTGRKNIKDLKPCSHWFSYARRNKLSVCKY